MEQLKYLSVSELYPHKDNPRKDLGDLTDHSGTIGDTEHELIKDRDSDGWLIGNVSDGQMTLSDYYDDPEDE